MGLLSKLFSGTAERMAWNGASHRYGAPLTEKAKTLEAPNDTIFTAFVRGAFTVLSYIIGPDRPKTSELPFHSIQLTDLNEEQWNELYTILIASFTNIFLVDNPLFQIYGRTKVREMVTKGLLDIAPKPEMATQFPQIVTKDIGRFGFVATDKILDTLGIDATYKLTASVYITEKLMKYMVTAAQVVYTELTDQKLLKVCPSCEGFRDAKQDKCPNCGHDLTDTEAHKEEASTPEGPPTDWLDIAASYELTIDDLEMSYLLSYQDEMSSHLGGALMHPDALYSLGIVSLTNSFFSAGVEYEQQADYEKAVASFEKAKKIIPWPTVLYGLGHSYRQLNNTERAVELMTEAKNALDKRASLLSEVLPKTLPVREKFSGIMERMLNTQIGIMGFSDEKDFRKAIAEELP